MKIVDTRKLAEKLFCFFQKYDECINKYSNSEIYLGKNIIDKTSAEFICAFKKRIATKFIEPYYSLTKGKEVEEIERLIKTDINIVSSYLRLSDFIREDIVDLASIDLRNYKLKNNINGNEEIDVKLRKCNKTNNYDEKIFSSEVIEKSKLLKEYDKICKELYLIYEDIKYKESEEEAEA